MKAKYRIILYVSIISRGGMVVGIDTGIIATTIEQSAFTAYMFPPGTHNASSLLGAIVSMGSAGSAIGSLLCGFLLEKFGRKMTLFISTFFTIVGAIIQTAASGVAMMIVGRTVAGCALGILLPCIPVYITELSGPQERARLVGVYGLMVANGFLVAGWMVMAVPLPKEMSHVAQQERYEDMNRSVRRLYSDGDEEEIQRMQTEIRSQIHLEKMLKRTLVAIMIGQLGPLCGALAIQNYQSILYASLGFTGQKVLLISAIYGFMGSIGQIINIAGISDKWPRVRTMWLGCLVLAVLLSTLMALSKYYRNGANINGARAGVALIFIYSASYAIFFNSTVNTIPAECFPVHLRGYGTSVNNFLTAVTNIWLTQVTTYAFDAITWRYYSVFIGSLVVLAVLFKLFLQETNQMTLESIAGRWEDETVREDGDIDKAEVAHQEYVA